MKSLLPLETERSPTFTQELTRNITHDLYKTFSAEKVFWF